MDVPPPGSTDVTIAGDVFCVRCQYNLRGLSRAGTCPECGASIPLTLHFLSDVAVLCPQCARRNAPIALVCRYCGALLNTPEKPRRVVLLRKRRPRRRRMAPPLWVVVLCWLLGVPTFVVALLTYGVLGGNWLDRSGTVIMAAWVSGIIVSVPTCTWVRAFRTRQRHRAALRAARRRRTAAPS